MNGDVLFGTVRPNLKSHLQFKQPLQNVIASTGFAVIRAKEEEADANLIYHHIMSEVLDTQIIGLLAGSNYPALNSDNVGNLLLAWPRSLHEQKAIAVALSDADDYIRGLEKLVDKKRAIKQGAMQELLTGRRRLPGFAKSNNMKMTEIGEIPEDWSIKPLGNLSTRIVGGGTPSRQNKTYWSGSIPWTTVKDMTQFSELTTQESISNTGLVESSAKLIPQGTVIVSVRMAVGIARIFKVDVAINQDLKAIWLDDTIVPEYLQVLFSLGIFAKQIVGSGSTVKGISTDDLRNMLVFFPASVDEQEAIAEALSNIDDEIATLETQLDKAKQIKQAMMQELLTGRIRLV